MGQAKHIKKRLCFSLVSGEETDILNNPSLANMARGKFVYMSNILPINNFVIFTKI